MKIKICTKCSVEKDIKEFHRDSQKKDNLRSSCKECTKIDLKSIYSKNKLKIKKYYINNKQKILQRLNKYYSKNKKEKQLYNTNYYKINKNKIIKQTLNYISNKLKIDEDFKILYNLRGRLYKALKGFSKSKKTLDLVGCSIEELKQHLESQFTKGMSWDNYGFYGWHIDHIKPCALFDLSDPKQQELCFNYINLQPLWAEDNLKKSKYLCTKN